MKNATIPEVKIMKDEEGKPVLDPTTKYQKLEKPVIFMAEARGLGVLDDQPKPVCKFTPFSVLHPTYGAISKGHYVCTTKEIFERLINHPSMDKAYKIVKRLPRETDRTGNVILRGVATGGGREIIELNEEERGMLRKLVEIEARYFTKESDYTMFKGNIKTEDTKNRVMKEMERIKNKLNLKQ